MLKKTENGLFIVGTDTEVGKTFVTCLLARSLSRQGVRIGVYKPVASGCVRRGESLISEDGERLWAAANHPRTLTDVVPQQFAAPLAPNVAAKQEGKAVDSELLRRGLTVWADSDFMLVEGIGGLFSPISDRDLVSDLAIDFGYPLLVVVPNVLGCINQTLLTIRAAETSGLRVKGIVLNNVNPDFDESCDTNRAEIMRQTDVPILAHVEFGANDLPIGSFQLELP